MIISYHTFKLILQLSPQLRWISSELYLDLTEDFWNRNLTEVWSEPSYLWHNWGRSKKTHQQISPDRQVLRNSKYCCKTICLLRKCTLRTAALSGSYGPASSPASGQEPTGRFSCGRKAEGIRDVTSPQAAQQRPAGAHVPLVRKLIPLLSSSLSHSKSTDKTADNNQNLLVLEFVSSWEQGFPGKHSSVSTDMQTYPRPKRILPSHLAIIQPGRCSYYSSDTSYLKTVVKK